MAHWQREAHRLRTLPQQTHHPQTQPATWRFIIRQPPNSASNAAFLLCLGRSGALGLNIATRFAGFGGIFLCLLVCLPVCLHAGMRACLHACLQFPWLPTACMFVLLVAYLGARFLVRLFLCLHTVLHSFLVSVAVCCMLICCLFEPHELSWLYWTLSLYVRWVIVVACSVRISAVGCSLGSYWCLFAVSLAFIGP